MVKKELNLFDMLGFVWMSIKNFEKECFSFLILFDVIECLYLMNALVFCRIMELASKSFI